MNINHHCADETTRIVLKTTLTDEELALHDRWEHEPTIHHLHVVLGEGETIHKVEREALRDHWLARDVVVERYFIETNGAPVGTASIHVDPPWMLQTVEGSGWLGLCIGEASARGKGIGRRVMQLLHERCRVLGCRRIEIGVFEFNHRARNLYRSLGYREIAEIPDFTWYDGRWWSDIRLEVIL